MYSKLRFLDSMKNGCITDSGHKLETTRQNVEKIEYRIENYFQSQDIFAFRLSGSRSVGVFVKYVYEDTNDNGEKRLEIGDQVLKINDLSCTGLTADQVVRVLRSTISSTGKVVITVYRHFFRKTSSSRLPNSILHSISDTYLSTKKITYPPSSDRLENIDELPCIVPQFTDDTSQDEECSPIESDSNERTGKGDLIQLSTQKKHFSHCTAKQTCNTTDIDCRIDNCQVVQKSHSLFDNSFQEFINSAPKRNFRKENVQNELPLVCLDQFNEMASQPLNERHDECNSNNLLDEERNIHM